MGPRKALEMRAMTREATEAAGDTLQGDAPDVQKDASDEAIGALIERFVESYRAERNSSENTLRAYRIDLGDYAAWVKRVGVDALYPTHRQLRRYLSQLEQAQYARSTVNRRLSALRTFFQWLNVEGIVDVDPASALSGPKQPQRLPRHIRPEDMAKLLSVYAKRLDDEGRDLRTPSEMRNQAILEFLYACGARISEASGLELTAVDFEAGQCKVLGKGGKERIVPLHDLALASMRTYALLGRPQLVQGKDCPYFFVSTRGNQMGTDAMRKMFKQALSAAGLPATITPHDMRHTFATDVLAGGADLRSVQEMLGHASLSTTQLYTHTTPERLGAEHRRAHPRG